jgi:hypothetical protein
MASVLRCSARDVRFKPELPQLAGSRRRMRILMQVDAY